MYRTFKNQRKAECIRWHAYSGKRIILPPSNPKRILQIRHLVRHYAACLAVVDMLDAKDPYTAEHSLRVSKMCLRLALMLHLPRTKIVSAMIAAGAHDIGKVGVPDCVLLKEGSLDDYEYNVIKRHPGIGADVLLKVQGYERIAAGVWHHHERWDGSGYPDGQAGTEIPFIPA
ncbi:HD domain-containing protein [Butyricicoccus sp. 1XD8-22]|nr:HD domain-containing protein [Butyricicoccus sp. 1XD8-22]